MNNQELLMACLEKIELCHAKLNGEYLGGMPNQVLLPALREAITTPRPEAVSPIVPRLSLVHALKVIGDGMPPYDTLPVEVKDTCRDALDFICGTPAPQPSVP